jgi:hypothetical protein
MKPSKSPIIEPCRLCLQEKPLCQSHILSEFLYKSFYDSQHRIWVLNLEDERLGKIRKGIYERLLCEDCEKLLSGFESYADRVINGPEPLLVKESNGLLIYTGVDYVRFKLFLISLLWRMGVASHKFFRNVSLGPHQEKLRRMLLEGDPGEFCEYACIITAIKHEGRVVSDFAIEPEHWRIEGLNGYRFCIGGFAFWFLVSNQPHKFPRKEFFLSEKGELTVSLGSPDSMRFVGDTFLQFQPLVRKNIHRTL